MSCGERTERILCWRCVDGGRKSDDFEFRRTVTAAVVAVAGEGDT